MIAGIMAEIRNEPLPNMNNILWIRVEYYLYAVVTSGILTSLHMLYINLSVYTYSIVY
jgi:hypothetical protein